MKKINVTLTILFLTFIADAHEFWLQPKKFKYALGEEIKLDFMVGESFTGEFWDLKKHKAEKMELHRLSGIRECYVNFFHSSCLLINAYCLIFL